MEYRPEHLLWDLLTYRRGPLEATRAFVNMTHNADLCPAFTRRCDDILSAFGKYEDISYDIQGLRDEGTDVLVRLGSNQESLVVCIQVKSHAEVVAAGVIDKLILQWQRSVDHYAEKLLHYYIVLCADGMVALNRVRDIQAEFAKKPQVTVIAPELAWPFLRYSTMAIDALVRAKAGEDDVVVRAALQISADLTPTELAILLYCINQTLGSSEPVVTLTDLRSSGFMEEIYERTPDYDRDWYFADDGDEDGSTLAPLGLELEDRIVADLDFLEGQFVEQIDQGGWRLLLSTVKPLALVLLDGAIRYDYEDHDLLVYGLEVLAADKLWVADHQH